MGFYNRSVCVMGAGFGGRPASAVWWRSLVGSALSYGACRWRLRSSSRSFTGAVVVVGFRSRSAADIFSSAWAEWCGVSVAVRGFAGGVWGVSVPVSASGVSLSPVPAALPALGAWLVCLALVPGSAFVVSVFAFLCVRYANAKESGGLRRRFAGMAAGVLVITGAVQPCF